MGDDEIDANKSFADVPLPQPVEWEAPEFVHHDKSSSWYLILGLASLVFAGLIYLFFKDVVTSIVIIVVAIVFGIYGARKPRLLPYRIDAGGISVGVKFYPFEELKSFSVKPEGDLFNITVTPLKRFAPYIFVYYLEKYEKDIMAVLASRLPYEEPKNDVIDGLMRRVRF